MDAPGGAKVGGGGTVGQTGGKNWGCGSVSCPSSPVPQICVVASNVVQLSKVTRKVTVVH